MGNLTFTGFFDLGLSYIFLGLSLTIGYALWRFYGRKKKAGDDGLTLENRLRMAADEARARQKLELLDLTSEEVGERISLGLTKSKSQQTPIQPNNTNETQPPTEEKF